jgi:hypothetical protein
VEKKGKLVGEREFPNRPAAAVVLRTLKMKYPDKPELTIAEDKATGKCRLVQK